jgi:histone H3/H4
MCVYLSFFCSSQISRKFTPQHQGGGVAAIGKAIGELWKALTPSDKEPYENQAAKEKMQYSRNKQRLIDAGKWQEKGGGEDGGGGGGTGGEDGDPDALIFPLQRIRKICKLDPDVKGISKESALLITKAAELFTSKLGKECVVMAQMQNRRKLMTDDVVTVCSTKEAFMFLRADLQDVKDEQDAEAKLNKKDKERAAKEAGEMQSTATRNNLDSYFGRPTSSATDAVSEKVTP